MRIPSPTPSPLVVAGRHVGVLGAARSGVGSALLLTRAGASVTVGDRKPADQLDPPMVERILQTGADLRPGLATLEQFGSVDLLVTSPGVPVDAPILEAARQAGTPVIGEVELAYRFARAPILAVAGTNGKGTATTLLGAMLNEGGVRARVCGNIGDPFTGAVAEAPEADVFVTEISSFQLETIEEFRPWVAVLLNVTPDHLDRHRTMEDYLAAKARLFTNQTPDDWAVLNTDDGNVAVAARDARSRRVMFSARVRSHARVEGDVLLVDLGEGPLVVCRRSDLVRQGAHYTESVLASASAALIAGAGLDGILAAIRAHKLPAHVLEVVTEVDGVAFINSSKATNPAAAEADIESVEGPLLIVAGGLEKRADFTEFGEVLRRRAKGAFLIGECAARIAEAARGVPTTVCGDLEEATRRAYAAAAPGDKVMLAPACASWDMFPNYAVRGEQFAEIARSLRAESSRR
jgi:UDP-N-acetylmuramoylalanine--D-glutamate ligase